MKHTRTIPFKENRHHGTQDFPCAFYQIDNTFFPPSALFQVKHHWHEELEIVHFQEGTFQFECNMQKYEIDEECFCFIGSEDLHLISSNGIFQEQALVFSLSVLSFPASDPVQQFIITPLAEHAVTLPPVIQKSHPCFEIIKKEFSQISAAFDGAPCASNFSDQYLVDSPANYLLIKGALCNILAALARQQLLSAPSLLDEPDRRITAIKQALSYMKEHCSEKLYISDIAGQLNMNEQYFCRFFKKIIGKSPIEYLNEMRIKNACHLLRSTELSVMEVCLECGFNNLGNFMRAFRKYCNCTPLQYRKSK